MGWHAQASNFQRNFKMQFRFGMKIAFDSSNWSVLFLSNTKKNIQYPWNQIRIKIKKNRLERNEVSAIQ